MKKNLLKRFNAIIAFLMGLLGFMPGCQVCEYGAPYSELSVEGEVTSEVAQPLKGIDVAVYEHDYFIPEVCVTDSFGRYSTHIRSDAYPTDSVKLVATDPAGVYASDSTKVPVQFTGADGWYKGSASVTVNFTLKKN